METNSSEELDKTQQRLGFATLGLLGFDVICIIISLATDHWMHGDFRDIKISRGLWKICGEGEITVFGFTFTSVCGSYEGSSEDNTVRAMIFLGLFLVCGAIVCVVLKLKVLKEKKELLYGATGLSAFAGVFLLVGFAVFIAELYEPFKDLKAKLNAGFAFCIIAWILSWAGAGTSAKMAFMTNRES